MEFISLHHGCEVELRSGPGPTISRALRDRRYLATFIQLSLLGWMHKREDLASMLASSLRKRTKLGIPGASHDPGQDGIMNTIAACSTQSSAFDWSYYAKEVEERLRTVVPMFRHSADYVKITPALLLGAMDCLYMVQSLPDDRRIVISNEVGSVTFIVWAHYVLGLQVAVTGKVKSELYFGKGLHPQVTIQWTQAKEEEIDEVCYRQYSDWPEPEIRLLDSEMIVLLRCFPHEDDRKTISAEERYTLLGWGTEYLRRVIGTNTLTAFGDPVYKEFVSYVAAIAIHASQRLDRDMQYHEEKYAIEETSDSVEPRPTQIEYWRVVDAVHILFDGIAVDPRVVEAYLDYVRTTILDPYNGPVTFDAFLQKTRISSSSAKARLFDTTKYLSRIVLIFAHVTDITACASVPLLITSDYVEMIQVMESLCKSPTARARIKAESIFHAVATLLIDGSSVLGSKTPEDSLFLRSDFGWSVFLDTVGDRDPEKVRPELVHLKPGTPTNIRTNERKLLLLDGHGCARIHYPNNFPLLRGAAYIPRSAAKVSRRLEFWTSRTHEFESTLYFSVQPSAEWCTGKVEFPDGSSSQLSQAYGQGPPAIVSPFEEIMGYREMQARLWQTYSTPNDICSHTTTDSIESPVKLGPDAAVLFGFRTTWEVEEVTPQKILIYLTQGEPRLRWLAMQMHERVYDNDYQSRELMLRTVRCCNECALIHVAGQKGKWILVL